MIYALGSNLFKAVVVASAVPAVVSAGPGCCGGQEEHAHEEHAHDLADAGEAESGEGMGGMDIAQMMKDMGMEGMDLEKMMAGMGDMGNMGGKKKQCGDGSCCPADSECGSTCCPSEEAPSCSDGQCTSPCCGEKDMNADDAAAPQGNEAPANESTTSPPSDEEFGKAKAELGLTEEDENNILEYVKKIPAVLKDPKFEDEDIAKMFVHQYFISEDEVPAEGEEPLDPKSRENLLEEIQHLVEVEIPEMMTAQQKQKMGGMPKMPEMPEELSPEDMDQALDDMDNDSEAPALVEEEAAPEEVAADNEGMNVEL